MELCKVLVSVSFHVAYVAGVNNLQNIGYSFHVTQLIIQQHFMTSEIVS
jgi:hypothetical protein